MPNVNYVQGRSREYRTMKLLEAAGYECIRAAGSHGTWDVVGVNNSSIVLVQVKFNHMPTLAEIEKMEEALAPDNAVKLIHLYKKGQHAPEVLVVG